MSAIAPSARTAVRARVGRDQPARLRPPGAKDIAVLFALATVSRAVLLTVVPLQALAHLGDAQGVSVLYLVVSAVALVANLYVPSLLHRLPRRSVYLIGAGLQLACAPLFMLGTMPGFVLAMLLQVVGIVCTEITLNLYLLDHIPRRELVRFEPLRIFYAGGAWMTGPWLGVFLQHNFAQWSPFVLSAAFALTAIVHFRWLGLGTQSAVEPRVSRPPDPGRHLVRYFRQPRLALAWLLAFGRSCWWVVFFVYAPIQMREAGASAEFSAAVVSLGMGTLFLARLWGRIAARHGVRSALLWGYGATGVATALVALSPPTPWLLAALLVAAAVCASVIDGVGNVPFLRVVRPLERSEMLSVFMTYRDASQVAPPLLLAFVLQLAAVPAAFAITAAGMLILVRYAGFLHPRM